MASVANLSSFDAFFYAEYFSPRDYENPDLISDYEYRIPNSGDADISKWGEAADKREGNSSKFGVPLGLEFENDDAAWVMACTFIIFTMQTGFGLMESGICFMKNEVNILVKNVVDVVLGGFTFWAFGFGLITGDTEYTTPFYGVGNFFFSPDVNIQGSGEEMLRFFFQVAYVSSSMTIVSGAMAERCNFKSFMVFCSLNVLIYSLPAHWMWSKKGWLRQLGAVDIAGSGIIHALGGSSALVAAYMVGPRTGSEHQKRKDVMGNAQNSLIGLFMIWWAFLAFNSGSTFGVSHHRWMFSAKATVTTMISSFGGGCVGLSVCFLYYKGKIKVKYIASCVFSSLVAISASCFIVTTWEAFVIGGVSALLCYLAMILLDKTSVIDDPCAAFAVHGVGGAWGLLAVGIFAKADPRLDFVHYDGLLRGQFYLLGVQTLATVSVVVWSLVMTFVVLKLIDKVIPLRASLVEELLGADYSVHNILHPGIGIEEAVDVLSNFHNIVKDIDPTGNNLGHMMYLEDNFATLSRDARAASSKLTAIFGERVSDAEVEKFSRHNYRTMANKPRMAESGAFGRIARRDYLHFERHHYVMNLHNDPLSEESDESSSRDDTE